MSRNKSTRYEPKCTPGEFDEAIVFFALDPSSIARVRRVLVDGVPPPVVAGDEGVSPQALHRQYAKVLKKISERRPSSAPSEVLMPDGWESVTIVAPSEFIATVRKQLADYLKASAAPSSL